MEQALRELDNEQEELRKIKEEQDELAAKTAQVFFVELMKCRTVESHR